MNILITGGAGFIGTRLALSLADDGHQVAVLDTLSAQIHGDDPTRESTLLRSIKGRVRFHRGSVTDSAALDAVLPGQEAIVHLAAETGTGQSMYEIRRYVDVNVGGTARMLDHLANAPHGVRKVVVASSRALYGEGKYLSAAGPVFPTGRKEVDLRRGQFDPVCAQTGAPLQPVATDETATLHPSSVYGITKHTQEQLVMTACPAMGIAATALRYQNVYGPGQSLANPYTGILSIFSTRILNGSSIDIFEDGLESRDFVYIDDVVRATKQALALPAADGEVFGIGSGVATSVAAATEMLQVKLGRRVDVRITGAWRIGDIRHAWADITKARRLLAYEPAVDFETGIDRFAKWVLSQPRQRDNYQRSLDELKDKGLMRG